MIISGFCDAASIVQCCMAGANGCFVKPVVASDLGLAVSSAAQGRLALCPQAERALMSFLYRAGMAASSLGLTWREQQIVGCLTEHLSDKEIGQRLGVATNTVHVHLVQLFRKLGVHSR